MIFFYQKFPFTYLGLHKGRTSYRRSLQPSKENIQHFKTWEFFTFFFICGPFLPSWIRIQHLKLMRIRIHNPVQNASLSGKKLCQTLSVMEASCQCCVLSDELWLRAIILKPGFLRILKRFRYAISFYQRNILWILQEWNAYAQHPRCFVPTSKCTTIFRTTTVQLFTLAQRFVFIAGFWI